METNNKISLHMMQKPWLGLRTVIYKVPDLAAAKSWYSRAFDIQPYFDEPFYVGYNIAGYELGLLPELVSGGHDGSVTAYWGVPEIDESFKMMIERGATAESEPYDVGDGIRVAVVKDPWNNAIGLIYNPMFKAE